MRDEHHLNDPTDGRREGFEPRLRGTARTNDAGTLAPPRVTVPTGEFTATGGDGA